MQAAAMKMEAIWVGSGLLCISQNAKAKFPFEINVFTQSKDTNYGPKNSQYLATYWLFKNSCLVLVW